MLKNEYINKIEVVSNINYDNMIKEWDDKQQKTVENAIKKLFIMKTLTDHNSNKKTMYTFKAIEYFFGLPYTSSSSFAMLSNCNTRYCLDTENQYNIDCFGLGNDNKVYIFCTDNKENEIIYKIL